MTDEGRIGDIQGVKFAVYNHPDELEEFLDTWPEAYSWIECVQAGERVCSLCGNTLSITLTDHRPRLIIVAKGLYKTAIEAGCRTCMNQYKDQGGYRVSYAALSHFEKKPR